MTNKTVLIPKEVLDVYFPEIEFLREIARKLKNPNLKETDAAKLYEEKKKLEGEMMSKLIYSLTQAL